MSKDGYYGDFGSFAEEEEARKNYEKQCEEQDAISYMTNSIDELVSTFGYEMVNSYLQTLKEAMKPETCDGCEYVIKYPNGCYECCLLTYADQESGTSFIEVDKDFCCNRYERKDKA